MLEYMNVLSKEKRTAVAGALVEGNSINATVCMTGVAKHTILNLLRDLGCACAEHHNRPLRNVSVAANEWIQQENHGHAVAPTSCIYNFCRVHKTLRVTSAMEAGLTDHVWTIEEIVALTGKVQDAAA